METVRENCYRTNLFHLPGNAKRTFPRQLHYVQFAVKYSENSGSTAFSPTGTFVREAKGGCIQNLIEVY
jgi:hypothetical protein